jgi:hypothetical protein
MTSQTLNWNPARLAAIGSIFDCSYGGWQAVPRIHDGCASGGTAILGQ